VEPSLVVGHDPLQCGDEAAPPEMIETTVDGRYQILARVAAGGMGEVFRAHDPVLNREVALKMLHPTLAGDTDFIDRFRREARSAAKLSHPNIVAVHDWGQAGETYFMVMEYIRGPNLRTVLADGVPLQPAQAAEVLSQVLAALGHAHEHGIVHRDVKPENILITKQGVVKVADFGLARALAESRVTHAPGTVTGTVQYLAPEQIQGEPADPRTDLYAAGVVLYELLVGRVPFTGETSVAIAYRHLQDPMPVPSSANPMVPTSLDEVVAHATEKDRERRVESAERMRKELANSTAELPPAPPLRALAEAAPSVDEVPPDRARTVTIPEAMPPRKRRRRRLATFARVIALLAVLAAAGWATWTYLVPHRTDAPRLQGLTIEEAQGRAEEAQLALVVGGREYSSDVEAGRILSQEPGAGEVVERGTEIRVVLSRGPELVAIPDVTDGTLQEARRALRRAGLTWDVRHVYHPQAPEGTVVDQNPLAEREIEVGTQVIVTVSRGPRPISVPGVEGRPASEAEAELEAAGLRVATTQEFSDRVPRGNVIRQSPEPEAQVLPGTTVELVVSRGPREFPMPRVIGKDRDEAITELQRLGLEVETTRVPGTTGTRVVGQSPRAGTTVPAGSRVTIYIGGG
ncbi:MAG TPA: Stk1 family PASTA domain-containing Ser/Thr kinase, partial [Actinomycetota bacterium]